MFFYFYDLIILELKKVNMFIGKQGKFIEEKYLSDRAKRVMYNMMKFAIYDAYMGGVMRPSTLQKDMVMITKGTGSTKSEIQEVINCLFSDSMTFAFDEGRTQVGFSASLEKDSDS